MDANAAALNQHMAEQDRNDRVMELYGEEARQILSDRIWNERWDSIEDDLRGYLEDLDEGLADLLLDAAHYRQVDLVGCFAGAAMKFDANRGAELRTYLDDISPNLTAALYRTSENGDVIAAGEYFLQILDTKCDSLIDQQELADKAHELARGE